MSIASRLIQSHGILFQIERNGEIITTALGLPNHDQITAESFIGMLENADVEIGDWLINPNNERFYVKDKISDYAFHEFQQYRLLYLTEAQYHSKQSMHSVTTFNIQNAYGSVIGSQSSVVMNYNAAIQNAKKEIEASNSPDKEDLDKIISLLEMIVNNQLSPQKGLFSKFSSVMERNSWITGTITSIDSTESSAKIIKFPNKYINPYSNVDEELEEM